MISIPMNFNFKSSSSNSSIEQQGPNSESMEFSSLACNPGCFQVDCLNSSEHHSGDMSVDTDENMSDFLSGISPDILDSLESFAKDLIVNGEDFELNEDLSFLQAFIPLFIQRDESIKVDSINAHSSKVGDILNESGLHPKSLESALKNLLDTESKASIPKEFFTAIDKDFITNFEKLETIELKKGSLVDTFDKCIKEVNLHQKIEDVNINGFYNSFKTSFENYDSNALDTQEPSIDSIESLDTSDMIELLSSGAKTDSNKSVESSKLIKNSDLSNSIINQDTLVDDLNSTIISMKNANLKQLKLKLSPKELGDMTIDISQLDNVSKIILTVSNKDTLGIIKSNLSEIIEHLKSSGLISSETSVNVQSDGANRESFSSFNGFSSNKNSKGNNQGSDSSESEYDSDTNSIHRDSSLGALNILA